MTRCRLSIVKRRVCLEQLYIHTKSLICTSILLIITNKFNIIPRARPLERERQIKVVCCVVIWTDARVSSISLGWRQFILALIKRDMWLGFVVRLCISHTRTRD